MRSQEVGGGRLRVLKMRPHGYLDSGGPMRWNSGMWRFMVTLGWGVGNGADVGMGSQRYTGKGWDLPVEIMVGIRVIWIHSV